MSEHPKDLVSVSAHATEQPTRQHYHNVHTGLAPETVKELLLAGWMTLVQVRAAGVNSCLKTMKRWTLYGCVALDWKKLKRKGRGPDSLWWGKHIERIAICLQPPPEEFTDGEFAFRRSDIAAQRSGYSESFLSNHRLNKGHPALGGKRISGRELLRSADGTYFSWYTYYRSDHIDILKEWNDQGPDEQWMTRIQLRAAGIPCTISILANLRIKKEEFVPGRIRCKPNPRRRKTQLYHVGDAKLIYAYADKLSNEPFSEKGYRWCPIPWVEGQKAAAENLDFPHCLLLQWRERGCPWLNGEKPENRLLLVRSGEILAWTYFFREDVLRRIKDAMASPPNQDLAGAAEAKREFGVSQSVLNRAKSEDHPHLANRRLKVKRNVPIAVKIRKGKRRGRIMLRKRNGYGRAQLQQLGERPKVSPPNEAEEVTKEAAAKLAGVSRRRIQDWIRDGFESEDGTLLKLQSVGDRTIEVGGPNGTRLMDVEHVSRPSLDGIIAERRKPMETRKTPYKDQGAEYLRLAAVYEKIGRSDIDIKWLRVDLGEFRAVWKDLFGSAPSDPLPFKKVDKPKRAAGQRREWGYLKQIIEPVIDKMVAEPIDNPADALRGLHQGGWNPARATPAPTADGNSQPASKLREKKNRGRDKIAKEIETSRRERLYRWDKASAAGIPQKEFCKDEKCAQATLKRDIRWRAMRRLRSQW